MLELIEPMKVTKGKDIDRDSLLKSLSGPIPGPDVPGLNVPDQRCMTTGRAAELMLEGCMLGNGVDSKVRDEKARTLMGRNSINAQAFEPEDIPESETERIDLHAGGMFKPPVFAGEFVVLRRWFRRRRTAAVMAYTWVAGRPNKDESYWQLRLALMNRKAKQEVHVTGPRSRVYRFVRI